MSREIPIIFNGDMVRAILAGQKTQTRRPVKSQQCDAAIAVDDVGFGEFVPVFEAPERPNGIHGPAAIRCPFGQPGDLLWVRETFSEAGGNAPELTLYRANYPGHVISDPRGYESIPPASAIKWRPSIHMPRWASRILLRVTAVRIERVIDISEADALAEGATPGKYLGLDRAAARSFSDLWDSIYNNWDTNPWVWVIEFERVTDSKREAA